MFARKHVSSEGRGGLSASVWMPLLVMAALGALLVVCSNAAGQSLESSEKPAADASKADAAGDAQATSATKHFTTRTLRGKVVWMSEALAKRFGVKEVPEAKERILALATDDGQLYPLVEDVRGRAFRRDARLRGIPLELLVRQYDGSPMIQAIRVYSLEKDGKYELDYWCDVCAIAMFELKPCDCCQGPIELRRRKMEESK